MFKHFYCLATLLIVYINIYSQWNTNVTVQSYPTPIISKWENEPGIASLTISNLGVEEQNATLSIKLLKYPSIEVLNASSMSISFNPGETKIFETMDFIDWGLVKYNQSFKSTIIQTGNLPEGDYDICVDVMQNNKSVSQSCAGFRIVLASPVTLISPLHMSTLNNDIPQFQWWQVTVPPPLLIDYKLTIVEVLPGQNPNSAMLANQPIYETTVTSLTMVQYPPDALPLEEGKNYAWRVEALSSIASPYEVQFKTDGKSEVRIFKIKSEQAIDSTDQSDSENIKLISPIDLAEFEADTAKRIYYFKWDKSAVKKSITKFILKISEIHDNQTPEEAINNNPSVYLNDNISNGWNVCPIAEEQGLLKDQQKYAWQVSAFSTAYNGLVAVSKAESFVIKNGVKLVDNVPTFAMGGYDIKVLSITNKNANYFGGTGEITLWTGAPKIQFNFHGLKIVSEIQGNVTKWKAVEGIIWESITQSILPITSSVSGNASVKIKAIRIGIDSTKVFGSARLISSLLIKTMSRSPNLLLETNDGWFIVDKINKISGASLQLSKHYQFTFLTPLNFELEDLYGQMKVNKNILALNLTGALLLPQNVKSKDGTRVRLPFLDKPDFRFDLNLENIEIVVIKLLNNSDILCRLLDTKVDLYFGYVSLKKGSIFFDPSKTNLGSVPADINGLLKITSTGMQGFFSKSNLDLQGTFRGYSYKLNAFSLNYVNGELKSDLVHKISNFMKGKVFIPFIKKEADIKFQISSNGFANGVVATDGISDWMMINGGQQGDKSSLKLKIADIVYLYNINSFWFNGNFKFDCIGTDGLTTDNISVSNMWIDSTGSINKFGADQNGWFHLSVNKAGKYNGFPIMLDKFRVKTYVNYAVGIAGTIVVCEDLSAQNGSPFDASVVIAKNTGGKSGAEVPSSDIEVEPIGVDFGNGETSFGAQLIVFKDDPTFGNGFLAEFNMTMHDPTVFEVGSKIIVGRKDGYSYWFIGGKLILPTAITVFSDVGIRGFEGRVYSHMKHVGDGILGDNYIPDKNNTFGVYAMCPITSVSDDGSKFWGKVALEIRVGNGFQSTLYGELNVLTSGFYIDDAKIKGTATIFISTNPKIFDSQCTVEANFWDALCGSGEMQMHISEDEWFLHVGTPEKPITLSMFCTAQGFSGYFTVDKNYMTTAAGFNFDTGIQHWGAGVGAYGKASGSITMSSTIYYKPLNFVSTASLSASGEIGVYIDVKVFSGYLCLLSGSMGANMEVMFPNPVCFAGKVYAKACIKVCLIGCKVCGSATFRMRYKNGSFSLQDHCGT